jgi:hypothetical protein
MFRSRCNEASLIVNRKFSGDAFLNHSITAYEILYSNSAKYSFPSFPSVVYWQIQNWSSFILDHWI